MKKLALFLFCTLLFSAPLWALDEHVEEFPLDNVTPSGSWTCPETCVSFFVEVTGRGGSAIEVIPGYGYYGGNGAGFAKKTISSPTASGVYNFEYRLTGIPDYHTVFFDTDGTTPLCEAQSGEEGTSETGAAGVTGDTLTTGGLPGWGADTGGGGGGASAGTATGNGINGGSASGATGGTGAAGAGNGGNFPANDGMSSATVYGAGAGGGCFGVGGSGDAGQSLVKITWYSGTTTPPTPPTIPHPPVIQVYQNNIDGNTNFETLYDTCDAEITTEETGVYDMSTLKITQKDDVRAARIRINNIDTLPNPEYIYGIWFYVVPLPSTQRVNFSVSFWDSEDQYIGVMSKSAKPKDWGKWILLTKTFTPAILNSIDSVTLYIDSTIDSDGTFTYYVDKFSISQVIESETSISTRSTVMYLPGGLYGTVSSSAGINYYQIYQADALGHGRSLWQTVTGYSTSTLKLLSRGKVFTISDTPFGNRLGIIIRVVGLDESTAEVTGLYRTSRRPALMNE